MTEEMVITLARDALTLAVLISGPMLLISLIVGLLVSIFQATTSIQEQTLTFVPKILAVLGSIIVFGPWMLHKTLDYVQTLFKNISLYLN